MVVGNRYILTIIVSEDVSWYALCLNWYYLSSLYMCKMKYMTILCKNLKQSFKDIPDK